MVMYPHERYTAESNSLSECMTGKGLCLAGSGDRASGASRDF